MTIVQLKNIFKTPEDVVYYIGALMLVAHADGTLSEAEKNAILMSAKVYADLLPGGRTFNELVKEVQIQGVTQEERKRTIGSWMRTVACKKGNECMARGLVADMIMLGWCDGKYTDDEGALVKEFAAYLGVPCPVLKSLESSCKCIHDEIVTLQNMINCGENDGRTGDMK